MTRPKSISFPLAKSLESAVFLEMLRHSKKLQKHQIKIIYYHFDIRTMGTETLMLSQRRIGKRCWKNSITLFITISTWVLFSDNMQYSVNIWLLTSKNILEITLQMFWNLSKPIHTSKCETKKIHQNIPSLSLQ